MPQSQQQVKMAHATLNGADTGMPAKVASEIVDQMHGRRMKSLPKRKRAKRSKR